VHSMASEDTEITLGVGKLLGLFFLLAAICGIFFSIGYSLGKSSGREQALNDQPGPTTVSAEAGSPTSANKPTAAVASKTGTQTASSEAASGQTSNLTFYNAVKQSNKGSQTAANEPKPAGAQKSEVPKVVEASTTTPPGKAEAAVSRPADVISHTSPVTGPGTVVVQIAAVSREDDAVALAGALRKKNYNVFVVNNPITNDKFYHVQVGPFSSIAEAEATKARLVAEGYNPIIKK
jgi:DedD protein